MRPKFLQVYSQLKLFDNSTQIQLITEAMKAMKRRLSSCFQDWKYFMLSPGSLQH